MLYGNAVLRAVPFNSLKPTRNARKQLHLRAVFFKRPPVEHEPPFRFAHHLVHIGKVSVHIILCGERVRFVPELLHVVPHRLHVPLRLHIVGRKRLVEIVAYRKHGLALFFSPFVFHYFNRRSNFPVYYTTSPPKLQEKERKHKKVKSALRFCKTHVIIIFPPRGYN